MYTIQFFTVILISDEGSSFLYIQTKNFSFVLGRRIWHFCVLTEGKISDIALVESKIQEICKTCAGRFQSSVKFLP